MFVVLDLGSALACLELAALRVREEVEGGIMSGEPSPTPMETGDRSSAKKARVESSPRNQVKQEAAGEEEAASGGSALLVLGGDAAGAVAVAAAARTEVVVRIDRDMLHCPLCTLPLKPPIFQVCLLF